jgi:hypothetical protein
LPSSYRRTHTARDKFYLKSKSLTLALILALCTIVPTSSAAAKVGATCTKVGAKKVEGGLNLVCTKQGKKLQWAKVKTQAVPKPTPTASHSPTATTSTAEAPKTETQSKYPASPTSFDDLWEKRAGIVYGVWSKVTEEYKRNKGTMPPLKIHRGANTPTYISEEKLKVALLEVAQLYTDYQMPKKLVLFYYSRADLESMTQKAQEIMGPEFQKAYDAHGGPLVKCNVPGDCDDGDAYVGADGTAYIAVGLSIKPTPQMKSRYEVANAETTEFYHSIQGYFYYVNKSSVKSVNGLASPNKPPHWLSSSSENTTSLVLANKDSFEEFEKTQMGFKSWAKNLGLDFTTEWVDSYVDIKNLNNMWSNNRFNGPGRNSMLMGGMINNILISIKGHSIMLDFHKEMSAGQTFEETFQKIFGVTWVSVSPLISKVVYDTYQKSY